MDFAQKSVQEDSDILEQHNILTQLACVKNDLTKNELLSDAFVLLLAGHETTAHVKINKDKQTQTHTQTYINKHIDNGLYDLFPCKISKNSTKII